MTATSAPQRRADGLPGTFFSDADLAAAWLEGPARDFTFSVGDPGIIEDSWYVVRERLEDRVYFGGAIDNIAIEASILYFLRRCHVQEISVKRLREIRKLAEMLDLYSEEQIRGLEGGADR